MNFAARLSLLTALWLLAVGTAMGAASTGMPYETPLTGILNSLSGPVVRIAGVIAIIVFGVSLSFSENGGVMRKFLWVIFGLSIAFSATTWGLPFLGFSGSLTV